MNLVWSFHLVLMGLQFLSPRLIILNLALLKGMIQQSILSRMLGQLHVLVP